MAIAKVILNGATQMDLTSDSVVANKVLSGETGHAKDGTSFTGTYVAPTFSTQSKSATPTESAQTIQPDSGYDGLSSVAVGAISSTYVGSGISRKASADLTVSGATVTAPAGYYQNAATKTIPSAGRLTGYAYVMLGQDNCFIDDATGLVVFSYYRELEEGVSASNSGYIVAQDGSVPDSIITMEAAGSFQLPTQSGTTINPTESQQLAVAAGKFTTGAVNVGAISSSYVGSGITRRSSTDLSVSGATITAPAGYYASAANKSVASGTAGTPSATKGSVSNHSVSVTPSVTNTTGYITGSTINGTAVTVSASELVSGSETVTENDTYDVTNLAQIVVDVPSGGGSVTVTDEANATGTTCVITSGGSPVPPTPTTWELVWQGSKAPNADTPYNYFWFNEMSTVYPVDGSVWRITADGTPYICTAYSLALEYQTVIAIGNPKYSGGTDDGSSAPFNFYNAGWGALVGDTDLSTTTHSFIFERQVSA